MTPEIRRLLEALPQAILADPADGGRDDFWVKWSDIAALLAASPAPAQRSTEENEPPAPDYFDGTWKPLRVIQVPALESCYASPAPNFAEIAYHLTDILALRWDVDRCGTDQADDAACVRAFLESRLAASPAPHGEETTEDDLSRVDLQAPSIGQDLSRSPQPDGSQLVLSRDVLVKADSYLSLLWYRPNTPHNTDLQYEVPRVIAALRRAYGE